MMSRSAITRISPISSGIAPIPACSRNSASVIGEHVRDAAEVKERDELRDHQQHEHEPAEAGEGLGDRVATSVLLLKVPAPDPVADAGDQEQQRDDEQQAVHERRRADDVAGDRVAQRGAGRQGDQQDHDDRHQERDPGELQAARLLGRRPRASGPPRDLVAAPASTAPAGARSIRSVRTAATIARMIEQAIAKNQFATIVIGSLPRDQADRLVGDLGDHRVGRRQDEVDAEDRADAGEAGGHAGSGCRPDARERGGAERDQDQVAGVGRDAREHADHDQDERQDPRAARPRRACG